MTISKKDLTILDKFDFEIMPVGVKFCSKKVVSIDQTAIAVAVIGWQLGGWISKRNSCPIGSGSLQ